MLGIEEGTREPLPLIAVSSPLPCSWFKRLTPIDYVILVAPLPVVHCWALPLGALGHWGRLEGEGREKPGGCSFVSLLHTLSFTQAVLLGATRAPP